MRTQNAKYGISYPGLDDSSNFKTLKMSSTLQEIRFLAFASWSTGNNKLWMNDWIIHWKNNQCTWSIKYMEPQRILKCVFDTKLISLLSINSTAHCECLSRTKRLQYQQYGEKVNTVTDKVHCKLLATQELLIWYQIFESFQESGRTLIYSGLELGILFIFVTSVSLELCLDVAISVIHIYISSQLESQWKAPFWS
jgi:hypothetical protein